MRSALLYLVPGLLMVVAGLLLFGSAGRDDAHIIYWPAWSLAQGDGMVNYNGERVEQSSTLLMVVVLGSLIRLTGAEPVLLGKLLAIVFGVVTVVLAGLLAERASGSRAAGLAAAALVAFSHPVTYWTLGGMGGTMLSSAALVLIMATAAWAATPGRSILGVAAVMALYLGGRPEAPFILGAVVLAFAFAAALSRQVPVSRLIHLVAAYAVLVAMLTAFRLWYFHALLPQPVTAKVAGVSRAALDLGIGYVTTHAFRAGVGAAVTSLAIAGAMAVLILRQVRERRLEYLSALVILYSGACLGFVLLSGGDWMEGGRFLVRFLPAAIACVPVALWLLRPDRRLLAAFSVLVLAAQGVTLLTFARSKATGIPALAAVPEAMQEQARGYSWFERHSAPNLRDMPLIAALEQAVARVQASDSSRPVVIMSGQMGMVPFHLSRRHRGQLRFLDRLGLADTAFTGCPVTANAYRSRLGLDLTYRFYFINLARIEAECGVGRPDIIFDLYERPPDQLQANGYTVVYQQRGRLTDEESGPEALRFPIDAFIAVRQARSGVPD